MFTKTWRFMFKKYTFCNRIFFLQINAIFIPIHGFSYKILTYSTQYCKEFFSVTKSVQYKTKYYTECRNMSETITKTVHQYSRMIPAEDMEKLYAIAKDYAAVKEYVYNRYSGVKSLSKLNPGYTVQNEMTKSGFRQKLGLPSVYFYLAIFEALGDIKSGWKQLRRIISRNAMKNLNFSWEEKHYVCYILKSDMHFNSVINRCNFDIPAKLAGVLEQAGRLNNYICRQVRKYKPTYHSNKSNIFSVSHKAYAYENGGIYLTTKVPRKRVFIPLTDNNKYDRQLIIELKENRLVIYVPIDSKIKRHNDYINEIGIAWGYYTMFTTSTGNSYGTEYGEKRSKQTEKINQINAVHQRMLNIYKKHIANGNLEKAKNIERNNLGRQKYNRNKDRSDQTIKAYINANINKLIRNEKPAIIYIQKLPPNAGAVYAKEINASLAAWQRGYIKKRLAFKCSINGILLKEVRGTGIANECYLCGAKGISKEGVFTCTGCGNTENNKINTAKVAINRGRQ